MVSWRVLSTFAVDMRKSCAVTIGFFDGVHTGHTFLLQQLEQLALTNGLEAIAVTFDQHPKSVVKSDFVPSLLTTQEEKLNLLSRKFRGRVIVLPFTKELSELSAKDFMQSVLRDRLQAKRLLMGYNHRFGHDGGTMEEYIAWGREAGIEVSKAEPLKGEKVSSSRIRNLISSGEIEKANSMLGYRYFLSGKVVKGKQIGRQIGFPTANILAAKEKLLPSCGVYAVEVMLPDGAEKAGMLSIGRRPTVENNGEISVEVHIFDFNGNLYDESILVRFIAKLRNEQHFSSLGELQGQIMKDAVVVREITNALHDK